MLLIELLDQATQIGLVIIIIIQSYLTTIFTKTGVGMNIYILVDLASLFILVLAAKTEA